MNIEVYQYLSVASWWNCILKENIKLLQQLNKDNSIFYYYDVSIGYTCRVLIQSFPSKGCEYCLGIKYVIRNKLAVSFMKYYAHIVRGKWWVIFRTVEKKITRENIKKMFHDCYSQA